MSNLSIAEPFSKDSGSPVQIKERDVAIDSLRSFVIVLVVFLHAALAYTSFSTYNAARYVDSSAPIVDVARWPLLDPMVTVLDSFMMSLMFFVSGLFAISSLERKGSGGFFQARLVRLGVPFLIGAIVLAPLAYWPSYVLSAPASSPPYLLRFFTSDGWQVGPPWFLWVLLVFNGIVAFVHWKAPSVLAKLRRPPSPLSIFLMALAAYVPLSLVVPSSWITMGPFDCQPVRLVLYFAFFLMGIATGTGCQWQESGWPKNWSAWFPGLGIPAFFLYLWSSGSTAQSLPPLVIQAIVSVAFAASCVGTSVGFLGIFRQFVRSSSPILDSLTASSFGIYLIHYGFVLWIQFVLLLAPWPAWIRFGITFIGSLTLSWAVIALLRRSSRVRRFI